MTDISVARKAPAPAGAPTLSGSALPLLILALAMASGFTMMTSFSTVQEAAKAEMGLTDTVLSLIQGVSAAVPLVLFSIPIGILVDRSNRLRLMTFLALVWTVGTGLTGFADNSWTLFAARMLAGIGVTGALTCALSLAADYCQPAERGRALLIVTMGKTLGQAGAFALTGWLFGMFLHGASVDWFGAAPWRSAHYALALISLATIAPLLLLREPARHEVAASIHAPFRVVMRELWDRRAFLLPLFAGQVTVVMADAAAAIWAAPVLTRTYGLSPEEFAGWMGALIFASGAVGSILGGIAADIGQKRGGRGGLLLGAVIAAGLGIPAALFPIMPSVPLFAIALGTLVFCGTITGIITSVALTVLIPNELRGLCIGAFIALAGLIGFGVAPTLVTWVSAMLGGERHLGSGLAIVGTLVSIVSLASFARAMRRAPRSATDNLDKPI